MIRLPLVGNIYLARKGSEFIFHLVLGFRWLVTYAWLGKEVSSSLICDKASIRRQFFSQVEA